MLPPCTSGITYLALSTFNIKWRHFMASVTVLIQLASITLPSFSPGSILAFNMVFEQYNYPQQVLRLGDLAKNNNTMENVLSWNSDIEFTE